MVESSPAFPTASLISNWMPIELNANWSSIEIRCERMWIEFNSSCFALVWIQIDLDVNLKFWVRVKNRNLNYMKSGSKHSTWNWNEMKIKLVWSWIGIGLHFDFKDAPKNKNRGQAMRLVLGSPLFRGYPLCEFAGSQFWKKFNKDGTSWGPWICWGQIQKESANIRKTI